MKYLNGCERKQVMRQKLRAESKRDVEDIHTAEQNAF